MEIYFEVCVDSVASSIAARNGGASRLEVCEALIDGGVTPSVGKMEAIIRAVSPLPVHILVRPRGGDFCYDEVELSIMHRDIEAAAAAGAKGVVCGVLTREGEVDTVATRHLFTTARIHGLRCVFHRAVDAAIDVGAAILTAARLGADEILTSGGAASALQGAGVIAAAGQFLVKEGLTTRLVAGGGLTAETAAELVRTARVTAVHGTCRELRDGPMATATRKDPPTYMGSERRLEPSVEYGRREATQASVEKIRNAMRE